MLMRLAVVAALAAAAGASPVDAAEVDVSPISREARFVIFGEMHGTSEIPRFFGDVVASLLGKRPLVVSLETPEDQNGDLQTYLASDGSAAAKQMLLSKRDWASPSQDGRASEAMFQLVERLRLLKRANPGLRVVSCAPRLTGPSFDAAAYEQAMAKCWIDAQAAQPAATLVALVGNAHSSRTGPRYAPAAASLPAATTLALTVVQVRGASWSCTRESCGETPLNGPSPPADIQPQIHLEPFTMGAMTYDGRFIAASAFTASAPAAGGPRP